VKLAQADRTKGRTGPTGQADWIRAGAGGGRQGAADGRTPWAFFTDATRNRSRRAAAFLRLCKS